VAGARQDFFEVKQEESEYQKAAIYYYSHIAYEQTQVVKALQEGLGAIRDVLLDGTQKVYCNIYRTAILQLQRAGGENTFINQAPRYVMEALGMTLIAVFVLVMSYRIGGVVAALPMLSILALGAQRLLPLMQQLYSNWSFVIGSKAALIDVMDLLDQPLPSQSSLPEPEPLQMYHSIRFENVRFKYSSNSPWVLNGIDLKISKGARVGIIGSTGSGKSTALDLLMGLLEPTSGKIVVDDFPINQANQRAWQRTVAHVPQSIFLSDASVAENIAFGVPSNEIDIARVRKVAQQARIADFIESRIEGYSSVVGERGVRLSGGQRQRIGIARALYKRATVLIFDEATSALDHETEQDVIDAIDSLDNDLTIIMVAHRHTTLKKCDMIIKIQNGVLVDSGTFEDLLERGSTSN
jgi:ATP-binding cassette subfamily B protein